MKISEELSLISDKQYLHLIGAGLLYSYVKELNCCCTHDMFEELIRRGLISLTAEGEATRFQKVVLEAYDYEIDVPYLSYKQARKIITKIMIDLDFDDRFLNAYRANIGLPPVRKVEDILIMA